MQVGIALPHMGQAATPDIITRFAQEAERLEYASLWAGERLLRPRRYVPFGIPQGDMPAHFSQVYGPLETLSFVAGMTARIKLGTSLIPIYFQPPVVLAKSLATLDQLSSGRLVAGLGQGWLLEEFQAAGVSFRRRGAGLEDYLAALRACWGPNPVQYEGRSYRIPLSDIGPKPYQIGGPPVILGVGARAALERAARLADGLNPLATTWKSLEWVLRTYREQVREAGGDPDSKLIVVRSNYPISWRSSDLPEPRLPLSGSIDQVRQDVLRLEDLGVHHIFFDLTPLPGQAQLELLEPLRQAVA